MPPVIELPDPPIREKRTNNEIKPQEPLASCTASKIAKLPLQKNLLFVDCLVEATRLERGRREFVTVVSLAFQSLVIATILILPLVFTEGLPKQQLLTLLVAPPPPPPPPAAPASIWGLGIGDRRDSLQNRFWVRLAQNYDPPKLNHFKRSGRGIRSAAESESGVPRTSHPLGSSRDSSRRCA